MTPKTIKRLCPEKLKMKLAKTLIIHFAKNPDIAKYGVESVRSDVYEKLEKFAQDNNLKKQLSKSTADEILCAMKNIDSNKFDGSLNNTIDLIGRKFEESLNSKTSNFADKDAKIKLLANEIKDILKNKYGIHISRFEQSFI